MGHQMHVGVSKNNKSSAVAVMGDRLATIDMGQKVGGGAAVPLSMAGSPSNTMCHGRTHCRHLANTIEPSVYGGDAPYVKLL